MKRSVVIIAIAFLATAGAGCASAPLGKEGLKGEHVLSAVRDLTKAYESRDIDVFMDKVSLSFPDREKFQHAVEKVFSTYQTIRFTVQETRMLVMIQYHGDIKAEFTWDGEWRSAGGKVLTDGSRVTLDLDPDTYKLRAIEGKNPYLPTETTLPLKP